MTRRSTPVCLCFAALAILRATPLPAAAPLKVDLAAVFSVEGPLPLKADAELKVVCFLGAECPLARLYGPRLRRLCEEFADRGVQVIGVNSNPQDSPADVRRYAAEHQLPFPVVKDHNQSLAVAFGATRTPEVFLLDAENVVRYRGRIDNQYEPGISRPGATRHELRDAIEALLANRPAPIAKTQAVGCRITFATPRPQPTPTASAVTFTRDVAPVLNQYCVECHRAGEIGPFALTDYDEVVGWADMMLEVVEQNRMPPWHADPSYGKFVGARQMTHEARQTLADWVAQGMPLGDAEDLPPAPQWTGGWHLPTAPDWEIAMRERPFVVPAEGTVEYQYFVVDPQWEEDHWIRAAQVIPGNASVVHHAIVFVRPPDEASAAGIGWMGAYVPGQRTTPLPPGHARRIPAHSKLVFQMHYTPNGSAAADVTRVGVWLSDAQNVTHEVTTRVALNHDFEIPPGASSHLVDLRLDGFARDSQLLGATPHMHLRGQSFRLDLLRGPERETLLSVPHYDFNWQHWYQFQTPISLADVDALEMEVRFDNSTDNPANPSPDEYVTWGDQTWEEMAVAFFDVAHPRDKPRVISRPAEATSDEEVAEQRRRIDRDVARFTSQMDRNGDGVVTREETPDAFRRFGFRRMDRNRDGVLDRDEIEAEADRGL